MLLKLISGFLLGLLMLAAFAKLTEGVYLQTLANFDFMITEYVQGFTSDGATVAAKVITNLGSAQADVVVMAVAGAMLFFWLRHTLETIMLLISLAGGWSLNEGLKAIFHRARPTIEHLVEAGGYSYPSGHTMVSLVFYGMIGYLIWYNLRVRSKPAFYVLILTAMLVIAIGISRIYLGVHYPSDVLAGFAAGGVWLAVCIMSLQAIRYYKSSRFPKKA